jgi:ASC-1-like (ASCH) protein
MSKDLFLILKSQYFFEIKQGKKKVEYRLMTEYWLNRLTSKNWSHVTFKLGYANSGLTLRKKIDDIRIETIEHPFFGDNPVDVFAIYFH